MTNDRYTRHDSIQGVQIRITIQQTKGFSTDYTPIKAVKTVTIDEWQGKRYTTDSISPPTPLIEL